MFNSRSTPSPPHHHPSFLPTYMAHHPTLRRNLAPSPDSPSMDPTLFIKLPSSTPPPPDPFFPSSPLFNMPKPFSRLHPNRKTHVSSTTQKPTKAFTNPPPTSIDIHLQAKSMSLSADFVRTKHHQTVDTNVVSKEKVSKTNNSVIKSEVKEKKTKNKSLLVVEGDDDIKRMSVSLGGRRRSFCGSQVELSDFLASNGAKLVSVDMPPFMQIHAVDCARKTRDSLEKFTSKTLALTLKKEFDGVYGPAWHCIVGTSFGSFVTHSVGGFLYFSLDHKLYILLFKTTVQRAD